MNSLEINFHLQIFIFPHRVFAVYCCAKLQTNNRKVKSSDSSILYRYVLNLDAGSPELTNHYVKVGKLAQSDKAFDLSAD